MAVVSGDVWVTANFKETQLGDIRPGQQVEVTVDAYPGRVFKAHVDSIQMGTGARFSLIPAENATGNYVKVVQRVPVKIVFEPNQLDPNHPLAPGMSVTPEVKVG
jgi:membrane fusion protein (multidrug efflux system)